MSKFYANKFLILFSLIFFSSVYPEDQQTNLPHGNNSTTIQLIQELCKKVDLANISKKNKELAAFFEKFRKKAKKLTRKIIAKDPALHSHLISDLQKIFEKDFSESEKNLLNNEGNFANIIYIPLLTLIEESICGLALFALLDLPRIISIDQKFIVWIWLENSLAVLLSSSLLSLITTNFQNQTLSLTESCIYPQLKIIIPKILIAIAVKISDSSYNNNNLLANNFSSGIIAGWLTLPIILYELHQTGVLNSKTQVAQETKQSLESLIEKYEGLLKLEKIKQPSGSV